jgi:hypothetical protein
MASAIRQSQQWSICRHCGWFHQSIHVSHEISSISQRQSIRQWSGEGKTPTKGCLTFRPMIQKLWVFNNAMAKMPRTTKFCTHVLHIEGEELFGSQTWHAARRQIGITQAKLNQLYLSTSWNKVLSSLSCWLFFDQHTRGVFFQPPGNGCNSSCTRQTATSVDIPTHHVTNV